MFDWFNAKPAEDYGTSLAKFFMEKMPKWQAISESKVASKTEFILSKLEAQILAFKKEEKLNFYKKAKLANAFKWALKDADYDAVFSEKLLEWLVSHL
jgi:hypothetical protein